LDQKNKLSNLAGYVFSGKPLITPEPRIGKFQNWVEMKVNYPTDKGNTSEDFSDNFHNIENFVQVDHSEKIMKNRLIFSKLSKWTKLKTYRCQIIVLRFQENLTTTRFRI
jgi:hypothetical protein